MPVGFNTSFSDLTGGLTDIFGTEGYKAVTQDEERDLETGTTGKKTEDIDKTLGTKGTREEYLDIDTEGVERLKQQILGGVQGLASVFGGEQTAGLYNTSVAAQASGDLVAQLAGEIAKLTAKKVSTVDETTTDKGKVTTDIDETKKETGTVSTDIETISNQAGLIDPLLDVVGDVGEAIIETGADVYARDDPANPLQEPVAIVKDPVENVPVTPNLGISLPGGGSAGGGDVAIGDLIPSTRKSSEYDNVRRMEFDPADYEGIDFAARNEAILARNPELRYQQMSEDEKALIAQGLLADPRDSIPSDSGRLDEPGVR